MISLVKSVDFLEEIGTLYDLLIYLLDNVKRILISTETQIDFTKAITVLKIASMKTNITDQSEEQENNFFAEQESLLNNAKVLLEKRQEIISQFGKSNIISKMRDLLMSLKRVKKTYQRNQSKNLITQFLNGCKCQKINLILLRLKTIETKI